MALDLQDPAHRRAATAFLVDAAREAGAIALGFFEPGAHTSAAVDTKLGGSPVTEADLRVNAFLEERLRQRFPEAGWLSEETTDDLVRVSQPVMIIVDPIDGTRSFVAGDARWAVCLAIVADGRPVAGVVHAPALGETYAASLGAGAALNGQPIAASQRATLAGARAAGPKPLAERVFAHGPIIELLPKIPSLAYRLVQVARGTLDVALAGTNSHDWDIAAADLIVHEAGGLVTDGAGAAPRYNAQDPSHGILFAAPRSLHPALIAAARRPAPPSR